MSRSQTHEQHPQRSTQYSLCEKVLELSVFLAETCFHLVHHSITSSYSILYTLYHLYYYNKWYQWHLKFKF